MGAPDSVWEMVVGPGDMKISPRIRQLLLPLVLAFAFFTAFIPHLDYPYPLHVDEWSHLAAANELITKASVTEVSDPFSGGKANMNQRLEPLHHVLLAALHEVAGIPWNTVFRFFPSVVFVILVLAVYALAQRMGFGLEAALFASLTPTGVGILGPAFVVPMALAMVFIPLSLFVVFFCRGPASYVLLLIFSAMMTGTHGVMLMVVMVVVAPFVILSIRGGFRHAVAFTLALVIPPLLAMPWGGNVLLGELRILDVPVAVLWFVSYPRIIYLMGSAVIALALLGSFWLVLKEGKVGLAVVLGLVALAGQQAIFFTLHYGMAVVFYRALVPIMLMVNIFSGAGLMWLGRFRLPDSVRTWLGRRVADYGVVVVIGVAVVVLVLAPSISVRYDIGYYHMISESEYRTFVWVAENVDADFQVAVLEPWKATAFTAVTGKRVFTRVLEYAGKKPARAMAFLDSGAADSDFLAVNEISIVYSRAPVHNPDLVEVARFVYLLDGGRSIDETTR